MGSLLHLNLVHTSVIPFAVYEFIINHTYVREILYESFEGFYAASLS